MGGQLSSPNARMRLPTAYSVRPVGVSTFDHELDAVPAALAVASKQGTGSVLVEMLQCTIHLTMHQMYVLVRTCMQTLVPVRVLIALLVWADTWLANAGACLAQVAGVNASQILGRFVSCAINRCTSRRWKRARGYGSRSILSFPKLGNSISPSGLLVWHRTDALTSCRLRSASNHEQCRACWLLRR